MSKIKIYGLDLDQFSADEIAEKVNVSHFKVDQLLYSIKEGAEEVRYAFDQEDYERYWQSGLNYAPNGYETYKRLKGKKSPLTTQFVKDHSKDICCSSSNIRFWTDPIMIICLYDSLKKDGYYASSKRS